MGIKNRFEQRAERDEEPVPALIMPSRFSRAQAWTVALLGTGLTAFIDIATGPEVWVGPLYLLCIALAAWVLGWREAVGLGVVSLAITGSVNDFSLYPYGTVSALWNIAMRVSAVLMFIGLLNHARNSYAREWRLARTDALTGTLNRQAFFELADASTLSRGWQMLVYADLDGLKKLNDERGHAAGDQYLKAYVAHVRKVIRKQDIFARIGGDEFLVHIGVRDEAAGLELSAQLHREMNRVIAPGPANLRCSVGVLILPPGRRMIDRELRIADELMYESKQRGADLIVASAHDLGGMLSIMRH